MNGSFPRKSLPDKIIKPHVTAVSCLAVCALSGLWAATASAQTHHCTLMPHLAAAILDVPTIAVESQSVPTSRALFHLTVGTARVVWEAQLFVRDDPWASGTLGGLMERLEVHGNVTISLAPDSPIVSSGSTLTPQLAFAPIPAFTGEKTIPGFVLVGHF